MKVAMIRYNAGNVVSVTNALKRLGVDPILTDDPEELMSADKVILPGVGEASTAMNYLKEKDLHTLIPNFKQPFLGVCLGLQLMCKYSYENDTHCIGVFDAEVKRFEPILKVPHMGWNNVFNQKGPLFEHIENNSSFYFVHSYFAEVTADTIATCNYINDFSVAMHKDNFYAIQPHPEKSGKWGSQFIENFLEL